MAKFNLELTFITAATEEQKKNEKQSKYILTRSKCPQLWQVASS